MRTVCFLERTPSAPVSAKPALEQDGGARATRIGHHLEHASRDGDSAINRAGDGGDGRIGRQAADH